MKIRIMLIFALGLKYFISLGQYHISAHSFGSYWEHTELYGLSAGIGFSYHKEDRKFSAHLSYGYGEHNRYKDFNNINYETNTSVVIPIKNWNTDISNGAFLRNQNTDYARNIQVNFEFSKRLFSIDHNKSIVLGLGIYSAYVEHAYTFLNIYIPNIYAPPFLNGPVNWVPISEQHFITGGINLSLSLDINRKIKIFSPFLDFGYGPNHSTYGSLGVRMTAPLIK